MRRVLLLVLALAGCGAPDNSGKKAEPPDKPFVPPTHAASVRGFERPVAAKYDSAGDVFFVANLGADSAGAHDAFISRMHPDGSIDSLRFIDNGRDGARLDAPQGLALLGDTLWVVDREAVRAFDARTGAAGPSISLAAQHPVALGGVAVGPDGALYIADPGLLDPAHPAGNPSSGNRVFRVDRNHAVSVAVASDSLRGPTDLVWDRRGKRFMIVSFGSGNIFAWHPGDAEPRTVGYNRGQMDGAAILPDGRLVVTSWKDSSLTIRDGDRLTAITGFPLAAHIGVDTRRLRVAVPLPTRNRVDIWAIPPAVP
ncbi:MAG TPA: hypothetical protein VF102_04010 [Gemmatimonadaceae bacterium]